MLNSLEDVPAEKVGDVAARTVACIEVRMAPHGVGRRPPPTKPQVLERALRQIEKAVRAEDRICPIGLPRIAVEFGAVASAVLPQALGDRLAGAVAHSTPFGTVDEAVAVSVGMATPERQPVSSSLVRRAMAAARAGSSQISPSRGRAGSSTTVVTVDRLLSGRTGCTRPGQIFQPIHRRSVYRYETGNVRGLPSIASSSQSPVSPPPPTRPQSQGTLSVLVIDPLASTSGEAGLAAVSAGSIVEGAGCRVAVMSFSLDDQLVLAVDGAPLDLVVLVLDGCRLGRPRRQASGAWGVPGRLTASYIAAGIPVVAVDAGAGAAMLASCVARGAPALFSLDRLPDALASLQTFPDGELLAASETSLSPRFAALVGLTASERRVLFYLTEGWAAQDIADELVVSLTTVRSHIRSVLRKLGVKSQLAAVAIANSRDLEDDASGEAS